MKKEEVIEYLARRLNINKTQGREALHAVFEAITKGLEEDGEVSFMGFGKFEVTKRKARPGVNPSTGEPLTIPAAKVVKFRPGKDLKETINK